MKALLLLTLILSPFVDAEAFFWRNACQDSCWAEYGRCRLNESTRYDEKIEEVQVDPVEVEMLEDRKRTALRICNGMRRDCLKDCQDEAKAARRLKREQRRQARDAEKSQNS